MSQQYFNAKMTDTSFNLHSTLISLSLVSSLPLSLTHTHTHTHLYILAQHHAHSSMGRAPSAALERATPPLLQHSSGSHNSSSVLLLLSQGLRTGSSCQHTVYLEDHFHPRKDVGGCFWWKYGSGETFVCSLWVKIADVLSRLREEWSLAHTTKK